MMPILASILKHHLKLLGKGAISTNRSLTVSLLLLRLHGLDRTETHRQGHLRAWMLVDPEYLSKAIAMKYWEAIADAHIPQARLTAVAMDTYDGQHERTGHGTCGMEGSQNDTE
jgi:hypothetical protein